MSFRSMPNTNPTAVPTDRQSTLSSSPIIPSVLGDARGERHPVTLAPIQLDSNTVKTMFNSVLQRNDPALISSTAKDFLLPVDLLISLDENNQPILRAAIPSAFAVSSTSPLSISGLSLTPTPLSLPTPTNPSIAQPESSITPTPSSSLNPAAAAFTPSVGFSAFGQPFQRCETIAEHDDEGQPSTPGATQQIDSFEHNIPPRFRNQQPPSSTKPKIIKLLVEFVRHVTLPNREDYPPNKLLKKTWELRNVGEHEWGNGVELVYVKGDASLSLLKRYPVVNAQPGETVEVSATIKTKQKPGRCCTYFRLQKNGRFFGPRVWVDIIVGGDTRAPISPPPRVNSHSTILKCGKQAILTEPRYKPKKKWLTVACK